MKVTPWLLTCNMPGGQNSEPRTQNSELRIIYLTSTRTFHGNVNLNFQTESSYVVTDTVQMYITDDFLHTKYNLEVKEKEEEIEHSRSKKKSILQELLIM